MKNKFLLAIGAAVLAFAVYSCQDPNVDPASASTKVASQEVTPLPSKYLGIPDAVPVAARYDSCKRKKDITYYLEDGELDWTADSVYCLCGDIRVPAKKQLNINPNVVVRGIKATAGSLTVVVNARINAAGAPGAPIIFTSSENVGQRAPMDWGGVIILDDAQINPTAPVAIEGFPPARVTGRGVIAGPPLYGSNITTNNSDTSGVFKYVRIEFGGVPLPGVANSEKNGLTLGAVGSSTVLEHVQVSSGGDDGFEWFGGTINGKWLISHKNLDDDFDTDFGYSGHVQYGLVSRDPARADISASNGFESDNNGTGTTATPRTAAIFTNFTVIGPIQCPSTTFNSLFNDGLHLRRATTLSVVNSVIVGWNRFQVFAASGTTPVLDRDLAVAPQTFPTHDTVSDASTSLAWINGVNRAVIANTACTDTTTPTFDPNSIYRKSGLSINAWNLTNVNFTPLNTSGTLGYTSPLLTSGANAQNYWPNFEINGTTSASPSGTFYIGARRLSNDSGWDIASWANYQPETVAYPNDGTYN